MSRYLYTTALVVFLQQSFSQNPGDALYLRPDKFVTRYMMNDRVLKPSELKSITEACPEAHSFMKKAVTDKQMVVESR